MNYDEVIKDLQTLAEIPLNQEDENWRRITPLMFTYAENRIYRDLDFLATTTETTGTLINFSREIPLPAKVLVLRSLNVLTPFETPTWDRPLKRNPLERVSPEALDLFWPQAGGDPLWPPSGLATGMPQDPYYGVPKKYTVIGQTVDTLGSSHIVRFMPVPDKAYQVEFLGVIRPEPLSPLNPQTFLSINYADLLCAACMVFIAGYQRDFGAQADDPAKAMSWNAQYTELRNGVMQEAMRVKGMVPQASGAGAP